MLAAISVCGSFSDAAAALSMSQSAASQHVAALERVVGATLVDRRSRPVVLTEHGEALARHARLLIARLEDAEQELSELTGRRDGRVRLGSFPTALATFVPAVLRRFQQRHPKVSLSVVDLHMEVLRARLEDGTLDVAIVYDHGSLPDLSSGELQRVHLFDDTYRLALPRGHRLERVERPITLSELREDTWVGGSRASSWFRIVVHACREAGFEPRVGVSSDDYLAGQSFVSAGMGVALMPGLALAHTVAGISVHEAAGFPARRIWAVRPSHAHDSSSARAMSDLLGAMTARRRAATSQPRVPTGIAAARRVTR